MFVACSLFFIIKFITEDFSFVNWIYTVADFCCLLKSQNWIYICRQSKSYFCSPLRAKGSVIVLLDFKPFQNLYLVINFLRTWNFFCSYTLQCFSAQGPSGSFSHQPQSSKLLMSESHQHKPCLHTRKSSESSIIKTFTAFTCVLCRQDKIMLWFSLAKFYWPQKYKLISIAHLITQWPTPLIGMTRKANL